MSVKEKVIKDADDLAHWLDHTGEDDWEPANSWRSYYEKESA